MHLLQWPILLYLSFHAIAGFLTMAAALGMPGYWEKKNRWAKKIAAVYSLLLTVCWVGIKWLVLTSLMAFYFHYPLIGQALCILSLGLGCLLFISLILLYKAK